MKRFTLIVALVLMVAMPMMAERVTPETARKVAMTFLNNNEAKSDNLTDLSKAAGFPNLYIFNAEQGFVVMAADDCVQPILGYSLTGKFVAENMPTNVSGWLQGYNDEIQYAIDNKMSASAETSRLWKDLSEGNSKAAKATIVVDNLLTTTWDQLPLYNNLCPFNQTYQELTVTGCVATAMAQIMKYWNYPSHGIGSHSYHLNPYGTLTADFGNTTYDWTNMPSSLLSGSPTAEQIHEVAQLMYHCGVSVEMEYGVASTGGSGAVTSFVADALQRYFNYQSCTFKYKANNEANWVNMLKTELNAGRPLQYSGRGSGGGHSFVCCGYDSDNKFYFNWGWSGNNDGFYALNNLVPGSGGAGGGSYSFTNDQGAIFGIHPSTCTAMEPTGLTYTQNGNNVTLNWNAASGAVSYKIYCDNDLMDNAATNSYATTAPFGTHSYYVRSMDAGGELSLSSNTVTITVDYQTPVVDDLEAELSGNNAHLSWTVPDWCYPETPTATLTYGDGSINGYLISKYWAHRYLASDLVPYSNKAIYKISFYVLDAIGTYNCFIYQGSSMISYSGDDIYSPETLLMSKSVEVSKTNCWIEVDLDDLILIDGSDEIWVVINYPDSGNGTYAGIYSNYSGSGNFGGYWGKWTFGEDPGEPGFVLSGNMAFLIRTYLTDGTYTYHLYDNGVSVADDIAATSYTVTTPVDNTAHQYTVKTNYYGGETDESNIAGITFGTASIASLSLGANDKMTITESSKLIVSGTLSDVSAANLVLEDGAQLIHNTANVQATVKKDITAYSGDEDGWYFIASPVIESITPSEDNGLLTNSYDLYYFDQSQTEEWRNYEANGFSTLDHKTGYLYANSNNTTLAFAGTLATNATATPLTYNTNATFKGFNLIGNPYPCNTTISRDFYIINGNAVTLAENGRQIASCEGVIVKATGANETVTFNKAASTKGTSSKDCFDLVITQGKATVDRARVRLGEGEGMEKFSLDDKHSQISLQQNGQDFAVAYANGANEMPVSFKASQNGTYTLNFESESLDLEHLHLIDNLTGNDIDLLALRQAQGPASYTFEAKTTDYASRFKLVFSNNENAIDDNETFAYFNDGNIIVNEEGSLQIVDLTGRVVYQGHAINRVSTANMTAGVYVLRLINGEKVQTQKIVLP